MAGLRPTNDGKKWNVESVPFQAETYRTVPRVWAQEAYKEYAEQYGTGQSFERLHERGGFGAIEMVSLLVERIARVLANADRFHARVVAACEKEARATAFLQAQVAIKQAMDARTLSEHADRLVRERQHAEQVGFELAMRAVLARASKAP